jgi:hypothetical protein
MAVSATFFADSRRLYAETMLMGSAATGRVTTFQQAAINLDNGELVERLSEGNIRYSALAGNAILGLESSPWTSKSQAIVLATLPEYKQTVRVPFAAIPEPERYGPGVISGRGTVYGHDTDPAVSGDRKTIIYGAGHAIVCRRADDLNLVWTKPLEQEYLGASMLDVTPDGSKVAVAVVGGSSAADQDKFYVGILNAKDGSIVSKLPLNGREGISISSDGQLLAVSEKKVLTDGRVEPTVNIYDITSGSQVGKVTHSAITVAGFGNSGKASIGSRFTPDGKYLITSGASETAVWSILR